MQLQEDGAGIGYRVSGKASFGDHGILQKSKCKRCEILELYLWKYDLKRLNKMKPETHVDDDTLAQLVYSMYNGGPGQFHKFFKRKKSGKFYTSDKLFLEKYTWVKTDQFQNISKCLIGK
ncbi:MAG: hypothetical protein JRJ43_09805 [Deltaproteobacteria bacterium]|nr:hypothetical protein [Deltaproteobacteria bacterium]